MWHLSGTPYEVQTKALSLSKGKADYAWWMEMGMGKTAVTLSDFVECRMKGMVDCLAVVCPNSLKKNWKNEVSIHGMKATVYVWPDVPKNVLKKTFEIPFVIIFNYEAVGVGRGEDYLNKLMSKFKVMLVLDESICIKNPKSQRTKACLRLGKKAVVRRLLSGAPVAQGPHDLWAQLRFINAIPGFNFYPFRYTFCAMGGYLGKQVIGTANEDRLRKIMAPCSFRATKKKWLKDLPEKMFPPPRFVELSKAQKKLYTEIEQELYAYIEESGEEVSADLILTKLIKLQQIASGFVISDSGEILELPGLSKKLDETADIVEQVGKAVVFTVFNKSSELLMEKLKKYNPVQMRGLKHMTEEERDHSKLKFNTDPTCGAIVCQIQSGKYGHTLLGDQDNVPCNTAIYYENSFSLDDRVQSEDRIHRIGQRNACLYVDFITSPIDQRIVDALQRKMSIAQCIVDGVRNGEKHRSYEDSNR